MRDALARLDSVSLDEELAVAALWSTTESSRLPGPRNANDCRDDSAHVAGVAQAVAAGLGPHRQAVRTSADGDAGCELAGRGVEHVDLAVVPAAEPELAGRRA